MFGMASLALRLQQVLVDMFFIGNNSQGHNLKSAAFVPVSVVSKCLLLIVKDKTFI